MSGRGAAAQPSLSEQPPQHADELLLGGCQCGQLRFRAQAPFGENSICHCRMCQKATGALCAAFAQIGTLTWTRGDAPNYFHTSDYAKRGFCGKCGTPLTYEPHGRIVGVSIGTFDNPEAPALRPTIQYGSESKLSFVDDVHKLPLSLTEETVVTLQHPDHETNEWAQP